jgi:hypothetical protein
MRDEANEEPSEWIERTSDRFLRERGVRHDRVWRF